MATPPKPTVMDEVFNPERLVEPARRSLARRTTKTQRPTTAGLSRDAISKPRRRQSPATQARLRELAEITNRILPWSGSVPQAFAWYRSHPIPAFGDQTAEHLVRAGRSEHVKQYLAGIAVGGYA